MPPAARTSTAVPSPPRSTAVAGCTSTATLARFRSCEFIVRSWRWAMSWSWPVGVGIARGELRHERPSGRAATGRREGSGAPTRTRHRCPRRRAGGEHGLGAAPAALGERSQQRLVGGRVGGQAAAEHVESEALAEPGEHPPHRPPLGDRRDHRRGELRGHGELVAVEQPRDVGPLELSRRRAGRASPARWSRSGARRRRPACRATPAPPASAPRRGTRSPGCRRRRTACARCRPRSR